MTEVFMGGWERMLLWQRDPTSGAAIGQQTTLANGSYSEALEIGAGRTANFNPVAPDVLRQQGGDKRRNMLMFGVPELDRFQAVIDEYDTVLERQVSGGANNTANTYFTKVPHNTGRSAPRTMGVCMMQRDVDENGTPGYLCLFIPSALVTWMIGGMQFRGERLVTLDIAANYATKAHDGKSFGSTGYDFQVEEDRLQAYTWFSEYPISVLTHRGDGNAVGSTSRYRPRSSVVHASVTPNEWVVDATGTALTSFNTTTGAFVHATVTAAKLAVLTYQHDKVLV